MIYLLMITDCTRSSLAMRVSRGKDFTKKIYSGIFIGNVGDSLSGSVLRLVRLLETQRYIEVVLPIIKCEISYRLINGEYEIRIASITQVDSKMQRISAAIKILKTNFNSLVNMERLAIEVGMSISSFNTHFKSVTAMTALQYQKRLWYLDMLAKS
ncbi:AraC family transcriptional regulator N-terminal domain-containing protein [Pseudoalteromonas mariniglutinosa]|uniref:AraC family transcriptional regulator N-terminal domain-containing protein n=1 Tax=Pseudoalteromonas mariniglutinosa TaxID=206042 RepID=UPI00384B2EF8